MPETSLNVFNRLANQVIEQEQREAYCKSVKDQYNYVLQLPETWKTKVTNSIAENVRFAQDTIAAQANELTGVFGREGRSVSAVEASTAAVKEDK